MKSGFNAGIIAGIVGGVFVHFSRVLDTLLGLPIALPGFLTLETVINHLIVEIGLTTIFGAIFGIVYSKFYERIPGTRVMKGFIFGMFFFLISNVYLATGVGFYGNLYLAGNFIWSGLWTLTAYGLVLGAVYKE